MSKDLTDILYNPSSIASLETRPHGEERGDDGFNVIEQALCRVKTLYYSQENEKQTYQHLVALKRTLSLPLPATPERLRILKGVNAVLKSFASRFTASVDLFQGAIQLLTLLKDQVEANPQDEGQSVRSEWIELEKAVFHLSSWEGQLDYYWTAAH